MKAFNPPECTAPPPKSTVPRTGTGTIGASESSKAYLDSSNASPEAVTFALPSVMMSTIFAAIVLSAVARISVIDGTPDEGEVVGRGTVSAATPKSLPRIAHEPQVNEPLATNTPLTFRNDVTMPAPKLEFEAFIAPMRSREK